jgi:glutamine synthetase
MPPRAIAWAHENSTTALRVPSGGPAARRIEHRVAGGDINPYLLLAAILGAALERAGRSRTSRRPPITGNAYDQDLTQLPTTWHGAIDAFAASPQIKRIFSPALIDNMLATKRQELRYMAEVSETERRDLYLDTV